MYNKHTNTKTEFQAIIDNKVGIAFNTDKKRKAFIAKLKGTRKVTAISNIQYPWNPEDGVHNLISTSDFAKRLGIEDVSRIERAIKNGKVKTEKLGDNDYIVEKYDHYHINGCIRYIEN
jgi:hypothetical protein